MEEAACAEAASATTRLTAETDARAVDELVSLRQLEKRLGVRREHLSRIGKQHDLLVPGPRRSLLAPVAAFERLKAEPCEHCGKPLEEIGARMHPNCLNEHRSEKSTEWWDELRDDEGRYRGFLAGRVDSRRAGSGWDDLAERAKLQAAKAVADCLAYRTSRDLLSTPETARQLGVAEQTIDVYVRDDDLPVAEFRRFGQITWRLFRKRDVESLHERLKRERRAGQHRPPRHFYRPSDVPFWQHSAIAAWANEHLGLGLVGTEDLVGFAELRRILCTSRTTTLRYCARADFPEPVEKRKPSAAYAANSVKRWAGHDAPPKPSIPTATRQWVKSLRRSGMSYRDIAQTTGVSRGSVANICSEL